MGSQNTASPGETSCTSSATLTTSPTADDPRMTGGVGAPYSNAPALHTLCLKQCNIDTTAPKNLY